MNGKVMRIIHPQSRETLRSRVGLENTNEYSTYLNSFSTEPLKFLYISDIRNTISFTNNNCP